MTRGYEAYPVRGRGAQAETTFLDRLLAALQTQQKSSPPPYDSDMATRTDYQNIPELTPDEPSGVTPTDVGSGLLTAAQFTAPGDLQYGIQEVMKSPHTLAKGGSNVQQGILQFLEG